MTQEDDTTEQDGTAGVTGRALIDEAHREIAAEQLSLLSASEARRLTEEVKSDAAALWEKLLHLYEGGAHTTLGYSSWAAYCAAEFDMSDATAYRLLQAARVVEQLPIGSSPASEAVARELVPVLKEAGPEAVRNVYSEVVDEYGPQPTAVQVRDYVAGARDPGITAPESAMPTPATTGDVVKRTVAQEMPPLPPEPSAALQRWDRGLRVASEAAATIRRLGDYPEDAGPLLALTAREVARALADAGYKLAESVPEEQPAGLRRIQ